MPHPNETRSPLMRRAFSRGRAARMPLAVAVGAVVNVGFFAWTAIAEPSGLSLMEEAAGLVVLLGIAMVPFVVAGALRLGRLVFLAALAVACGLNVFGFVLAQDDSSSTAGLAAVFGPIYGAFAVLIVAGLDGAARALRRGRSSVNGT